MNPNPDEELFASRLAEYDAALAKGHPRPTVDEDAAGLTELESAKECLDLLEAVWPRAATGPTGRTVELDNQATIHGDDTLLDEPKKLGRFEILRELGRGGGGIVFLARDPKLNRHVALKVARAEYLLTPALRRRFVREAEAAAQLSHPNIVPIFEAGESGGICYLVSAYCSGPNLARWLRDRECPATARQAAVVVAALADGVAHMHARGILHRDIKPSNVLLEDSSAVSAPQQTAQMELAFVPRLTDFGLAKMDAPEAGGEDATRAGAILGTPAYMAPEQAEGRPDLLGPATDVYALGAVLYEMLAGHPPFRGASDVETLRLAKEAEPVALRRLRPDVGRDLETICLKCLEKDPGCRYPSAQELSDDLGRYLRREPIRALPCGWWQQGMKWARRRPAVVALAATLCLALLSLVAGTSWFAIEQQRHNAELTKINADLADTAQREHEQRTLAETRERKLRLNAYADGFVRARHAYEQGRIVQAVERLGDLQSEPGEPDLRGFEWHYLKGLCHPLHAVWRGHQGGVTHVAASADGQTVASASRDGTVRLWNVATGRVRAVLSGHDRAPGFVAFSPDCRTLASASSDGKRGELILWDVPTAKVRARSELTVAGSDVWIAYAADGESIAVSTYHGFGFWDARSGKQRAYHPVVPFHILSIAFAPDGRAVATGNDDDTVRLWDVHTGKEQHRFAKHTGVVHSVAYSPDGRTLASAGNDHAVRLWDLVSNQSRAVLMHPCNRVTCVAFSSDGRTLASASAHSNQSKEEVRLWDASTGKPLATYNRFIGRANSVAFIPGTRFLAVDADEKAVKVFDTGPSPSAKQLPGHSPAETWALQFAPDGKTLASGGDDGRARLWDISTGKERSLHLAHAALVTGVAFSVDGKTLASVDYDGKVKLWDPATGALLATLSADGRRLRCLALSPDGSTMAAGTRATYGPFDVRLWDLRTRRELPALPGHTNNVRGVVFSPDGKLLATACEDGRIRWWDTATWRLRGRSDDTDEVCCLAFAPDGQTLVSGNRDGIVRLWDVAGGDAKVLMRGHTGEVSAVAFTPDGRTVCSAGEDKTIRLWQPTTGRELMVLEGHDMRVNAVAFTSNGRTLASASHDGKIKLWLTESLAVPAQRDGSK